MSLHLTRDATVHNIGVKAKQGAKMKFDTSISDNYASFIDEKTGMAVFVDSFDNREFEVRIGSIDESKLAGTVLATSSEELNQKLHELFSKFQGAQ